MLTDLTDVFKGCHLRLYGIRPLSPLSEIMESKKSVWHQTNIELSNKLLTWQDRGFHHFRIDLFSPKRKENTKNKESVFLQSFPTTIGANYQWLLVFLTWVVRWSWKTILWKYFYLNFGLVWTSQALFH